LPVSYNGNQPVHIRLRNVSDGSFEFRLEEWDYLDGGHTTETISYVVMEAGEHRLSDGTTVEAGTARTDHLGTNVGFASSFGSVPVVLSQTQTHNGPHEIVTRQQNISTSGFDVKVQEEEGRDGTHTTERVGYVAIEPSAGSLNGVKYEAGTTPDTVTDDWHRIGFAQDYGSTPSFVAGMQTYDGSNTAGLRYKDLGGSSVSIRVEEETSSDDETRHTSEAAGYFTFESPTTLREGTPIGEMGSETVSQSDPSQWHTMNLDNSYESPVIVMQPSSANGGHPVHVRLRNVGSGSFEFQLEEWDYLDGGHTTEMISYVVMEAGEHRLSNGTIVDIGTVRTDHSGTNVGFAQSFDFEPVVLSQSQTRNGGHEIVTRQQNVSASGFDVRVQEEEGRDGTHTTERVGYVAIQSSTGSLNGANFEVSWTGDTVTHDAHTIEFGQDMGSSPVFLAGMQTFDGSNPAGLRYQNLAGTSVDVFVEEERSADDETRHTSEVVGYVVIADGGLVYAK
jgi:hypothetical protein